MRWGRDGCWGHLSEVGGGEGFGGDGHVGGGVLLADIGQTIRRDGGEDLVGRMMVEMVVVVVAVVVAAAVVVVVVVRLTCCGGDDAHIKETVTLGAAGGGGGGIVGVNGTTYFDTKIESKASESFRAFEMGSVTNSLRMLV